MFSDEIVVSLVYLVLIYRKQKEVNYLNQCSFIWNYIIYSSMSEAVLARSNCVRYKKIDGTLEVLKNELKWKSQDGHGRQFQCLYSDIKGIWSNTFPD